MPDLPRCKCRPTGNCGQLNGWAGAQGNAKQAVPPGCILITDILIFPRYLSVGKKSGFTSIALLLSVLTLVLTACKPEVGFLEGHVTIGPLVPVLREGEEAPTPAPELFAARQVVIYKARSGTEFLRSEIDADGNYHLELPTGRYVIDINHAGIDMAKGLPAQVEITAGATTRLDIDIDTGIR